MAFFEREKYRSGKRLNQEKLVARRGIENTDAAFREFCENGSDPVLLGGRRVGRRGRSGAGPGRDNHRSGGWFENRVDRSDAADALADPG